MRCLLRTSSLMFIVTAAITAQAGTINLNDEFNAGDPFMSDNYMWVDVTEVNGNPGVDAFNFYQDPQTVGDTLIVNPTNFRVDVNPGAGLWQIDSQLEMVIMGKNNSLIDEIRFSEAGDYQVLGTGNGTIGSSHVSAEVNYFWQVLEGSSAGARGDDTVRFEAFPDGSGNWDLAFTADIPDGATKVRFEFDNRLTARAVDANTIASIAKKQIPGIMITVPEPSNLALLCLALLSCLRRR